RQQLCSSQPLVELLDMLKINQMHAASRNLVDEEVVPIHVTMNQPQLMQPAKQRLAVGQVVDAGRLSINLFATGNPWFYRSQSNGRGNWVQWEAHWDVGYDDVPLSVRPSLALNPGYVPIEACDLGDGRCAVILDLMHSRAETPRSLQVHRRAVHAKLSGS